MSLLPWRLPPGRESPNPSVTFSNLALLVWLERSFASWAQAAGNRLSLTSLSADSSRPQRVATVCAFIPTNVDFSSPMVQIFPETRLFSPRHPPAVNNRSVRCRALAPAAQTKANVFCLRPVKLSLAPVPRNWAAFCPVRFLIWTLTPPQQLRPVCAPDRVDEMQPQSTTPLTNRRKSSVVIFAGTKRLLDKAQM